MNILVKEIEKIRNNGNRSADNSSGQDMWITSEEEVDYEREYPYGQINSSEEESITDERRQSSSNELGNEGKQKEEESSSINKANSFIFSSDHLKIAIETLISWISFDFTGSYNDESFDNFNSVVCLLRDKTISQDRQK